MYPLLKACALICLFMFVQFVSASAQSKSWRQYTTHDGLPSNEVTGLITDRAGYLWFATDMGICQFNGYEFKQPVDTSTMRGSEALMPEEDASGRIWFARLDNTLWFIANDTVRAWQYNTRIGRLGYLENFAVDDDGTVWLAVRNRGLLVSSPDGSLDSIPKLAEPGRILASIGDKVLYANYSGENNGINRTSALCSKLMEWKDGRLSTLGCFSPNQLLSNRAVLPLKNSDYIIVGKSVFSYFHNNQITWQTPLDILPTNMYEARDGKIFIAQQSIGNMGLIQFSSLEHLKNGKYTNILPGRKVTNVVIDHEGGLWATSHNEGIFYCINPEMEIYNTASGLPSNDIICLTSDGVQTVYAGFEPPGVCAIAARDASAFNIQLPTAIGEMWNIEYDTKHHRLWCSTPLHFMDSTFTWHIVGNYNSETGRFNEVPAKKMTFDDDFNTLYVSTPFGFQRLDWSGTIIEYLGKSSTVSVAERTFSVTPDHNGNIWVTTHDGLKRWADHRYDEPPFTHPALRFQPRDIEFLGDGEIAIGLRGGGMLLKDSLDHFLHFTVDNRLCSNNTTNLASDRNHELFVCTNNGLNLFLKINGKWTVETISMKQGLPSDQVTDATSLNGEMWVATDKGLARFKEIPAPYPMPVPIIELITVNNEEWVDSAKLQLKHNQNNITLRFHALHYRSGGNILYRYRLGGADTNFVETKTRDVNFVQLGQGEYIFEVQAQNTDGNWSASTRKQIVIHPASWQTWWFRSILALGFVIGLWLFYRRRLIVARLKLEIQNKIRDLETAALRAQMNPHFIFNCLVSIQQFISENDKESASAYLARFAKLVRLALHSSVDGRHTLSEEIEMLENYLALEQLRFKNRFSYEIKLSPAFSKDEISLPPLLIQPFVENAIVHGMKNKTSDGRIEIGFSKHQNALIVTVTDNGPGITDTPQLTTETGHKSVGMTLTQRRLDILSGHAQDRKVSHENMTDEHGVIIGSKVRVEIAVE